MCLCTNIRTHVNMEFKCRSKSSKALCTYFLIEHISIIYELRNELYDVEILFQ